MLKTKHPRYKAWMAMKQRCDNPNRANYKDYGGRGIGYHPDFQWFEPFRLYIESLEGNDAPDLSLDRIDNEGDYTYGNLRWATPSEQRLNQRKRKDSCSYTGVQPYSGGFRVVVYITAERKERHIGVAGSELEGAIMRDKYIREHNLPNECAFPLDHFKVKTTPAKTKEVTCCLMRVK